MYKIKTRIWLENNNGIFLGEGRIKLLKVIDEEGSLSKAAKKMNMSYKKAWKIIDSINQNSNKAIISTNIGGKGGGGTHITKYGLKVISEFEMMKQRCWEFIDTESKKFDQNV